MAELQDFITPIIENVEKVIIGKRATVELLMVAMLCEGHVLLEDVPGVGKTMLARSLAVSLGGQFKRLQCTPDLLPNDVVGVSIFNQKSGEFEFRQGPVFVNILLVDEINRATPRTQSALLEAMQEQQVTVDGVTRALPRPFLLLATQNPIEYEGTFPLPEAQLDRFMLRISLGYPSPTDEVRMLDSQQRLHPVETVGQAISAEELLHAQEAVKNVHIDDQVKEYIVELVNTSRKHPDIYLGASPRGSLALYKTSQAKAAMENRDFVIPDDVKALAIPALAHRLIVSPAARIKNVDSRAVVQEILDSVPVPGTRARPKK